MPHSPLLPWAEDPGSRLHAMRWPGALRHGERRLSCQGSHPFALSLIPYYP